MMLLHLSGNGRDSIDVSAGTRRRNNVLNNLNFTEYFPNGRRLFFRTRHQCRQLLDHVPWFPELQFLPVLKHKDDDFELRSGRCLFVSEACLNLEPPVRFNGCVFLNPPLSIWQIRFHE